MKKARHYHNKMRHTLTESPGFLIKIPLAYIFGAGDKRRPQKDDLFLSQAYFFGQTSKKLHEVWESMTQSQNILMQ